MRLQLLAALRKPALNLLLLAIGIGLAMGAGELLIRLVAPQQLILLRPDLWQAMDSVGWGHRPNLITKVNTGDRTVSMLTDSSGFRVGAEGRPPGQYRILLLGDSFMAAMQVEYEQSMAGLIDRCFASRTGKTAAVWNAGVAGWDPPQYLVQAGRALNTMPFDLVIVAVFLGNDIVREKRILKPREPDPRRTFRFPRRPSYHEFVDALLAPLNDGLETRSHLYVFLKNRSQAVLMRFGLTGFEVPEEIRRDQASAPRWGVTADILAGIDSMATSHKVPTIFALIPAIEQVVPDVFEFRTKSFGIDPATLDLDQPERLMISELQRRHLQFVSFLKPLRQAQRHGVDLYGRADMHPSVEGHRVMWNALAPVLAQRLRLPYDSANSGPPSCGEPRDAGTSSRYPGR